MDARSLPRRKRPSAGLFERQKRQRNRLPKVAVRENRPNLRAASLPGSAKPQGRNRPEDRPRSHAAAALALALQTGDENLHFHAAGQPGVARVSARLIQQKKWAGLDSNQRRRKASRFTVCPVWPLRYLPSTVAEALISNRKTPRCNLLRIAGLRARFPDRSARPEFRARRAPLPESRPLCG